MGWRLPTLSGCGVAPPVLAPRNRSSIDLACGSSVAPSTHFAFWLDRSRNTATTVRSWPNVDSRLACIGSLAPPDNSAPIACGHARANSVTYAGMPHFIAEEVSVDEEASGPERLSALNGVSVAA